MLTMWGRGRNVQKKKRKKTKHAPPPKKRKTAYQTVDCGCLLVLSVVDLCMFLLPTFPTLRVYYVSDSEGFETMPIIVIIPHVKNTQTQS